MNKKIIAIIILAVLLALAVGYIGYNQIYQRGFEMAQYSIAHQIRNTGNIPVYDPNNGTIIWYSLNQICRSGG